MKNLNVTISKHGKKFSKCWSVEGVRLSFHAYARPSVYYLHESCKPLRVYRRRVRKIIESNPEMYRRATEGDHESLVRLVLFKSDADLVMKDSKAVYWLIRSEINSEAGKEVVFEDRHLGTLSFVPEIKERDGSFRSPLFGDTTFNDSGCLSTGNYGYHLTPTEESSSVFDVPILSDGSGGSISPKMNPRKALKAVESMFKSSDQGK